MRQGIHNEKFSVHVIAGTHVITLAFDAKKEAATGLLGFAIHRTKCNKDGTPKGEGGWMLGYKPFEEVVPDPQPKIKYSTHEHPIQSFVWADFGVEPGNVYRYKVQPVFGTPTTLTYGNELEITATAEPLKHDKHEIHFNRGAAASQAYAERFDNIKPDDKHLTKKQQDERYKWLSHGLYEAVLAFIRQAKDSSYALRAAIYELDYPGVVQTFKEVLDKGANVKIVYEARDGQTQTKQNQQALKDAGFKINDKKITFARTKTEGIPHNKFIVLLKNNIPVMVWTGSTNLS